VHLSTHTPLDIINNPYIPFDVCFYAKQKRFPFPLCLLKKKKHCIKILKTKHDIL